MWWFGGVLLSFPSFSATHALAVSRFVAKVQRAGAVEVSSLCNIQQKPLDTDSKKAVGPYILVVSTQSLQPKRKL